MAEDLAIPYWTRDDYINTQKPFEWLYQFKDNKLRLAQMREQIKERAGACGVKNFVTLWNCYLQTVQSQIASVTENMITFDDQPFEMHSGEYLCDDYGVTVIDKYGFEVQIINHPVVPIQRLVNIDTGEEKLRLLFKKGNQWRSLIADKGTLASSTKILELAQLGVAVNADNAKGVIRYLADIEHMNYINIPEQSSVGRLGWIDGHGFSPYCQSLEFDGDLSFKHMFECVTEHGDYDAWLDAVKEIRKHGVLARIILAATFASVLVKPCGALPFFVHLWGGSEAGKTVGITLAASVWGSPQMGDLVLSFNSTNVGQETIAGFCNSIPLCIDELQVKDGRFENFDKMIYLLTEGVGRVRGARSGGIRKTLTWRNCILTTGETPITHSNSGGGAVNRVIDIDCKEEQLFQNPVGVIDVISHNYGFAGRQFIAMLEKPENLEYTLSVQREIKDKLISGQSTDKQSISASLILTADKLIDEWIFQDGMTLAQSDMENLLYTKQEMNQNERCYEWLLDYAQGNAFHFNDDIKAERWGMIDTNYIYFIKPFFDKALRDNGYNPDAFLSWAKRHNIIECENGRTTKVKRIAGNATRCVWIAQRREEFEEIIEQDSDLPF